MTDNALKDDFSALAVIDTAAMDWQASPSPSVWRKRLELSGPAEAGRVTSIVRYDADSRFHEHPHPDGEEILVLDGVFYDEHGDYPAGSFLLNPEGFSHAPGSRDGCVLLVKLRQYPGLDRRRIYVDTAAAPRHPGSAPGIMVQDLYHEAGHPERMVLVRMEPGTTSLTHDHPDGEEIFVMNGRCRDENGTYKAGTWARFPPGSRHTVTSDEGCRLYVKSGHLGGG